jgi:hypothetical protein
MGGKLFCLLAEGLAFLRTVDALQTDLLRMFVTENSYGVAVGKKED